MTNESLARKLLAHKTIDMDDVLQAFAEVERSARASERERCAKVADEVGMHDDDMTSDPDDPWGSASARIAALVRSLPAAADNSGEETTG